MLGVARLLAIYRATEQTEQQENHMSKVIEGVPESITREQYVGIIQAVGIDPSDLFSLEFKPDGIYAVVDAKDANGHFISEPTDENEFAIAQHRIFILVTDEEDVA